MPSRLFDSKPASVVSELRPQVINWASALPFSCHPGVNWTLFVVRQRFRQTEKEVEEYVAACLVCVRNKKSRRPAPGLLQPLPVPKHPWSDISLDFVTGPFLSEGITTVLTIVDRFSTMVHFIPLPKLPSAKETAKVMHSQVFRQHGLPGDGVFDRG